MPHSAEQKIFHKVAPFFNFYLVGIMQRKSPMYDFLKDCTFESCSTGPKFDQFIQRYAISIVLRYATLHWTMHGPALCGIALDHGEAGES
jgi:hypothetical protein